jgi:hypothetical protein
MAIHHESTKRGKHERDGQEDTKIDFMLSHGDVEADRAITERSTERIRLHYEESLTNMAVFGAMFNKDLYKPAQPRVK